LSCWSLDGSLAKAFPGSAWLKSMEGSSRLLGSLRRRTRRGHHRHSTRFGLDGDWARTAPPPAAATEDMRRRASRLSHQQRMDLSSIAALKCPSGPAWSAPRPPRRPLFSRAPFGRAFPKIR
jgi:hypothetical protein